MVAIDVVQSEYGWTDEYVLDLTIDRIAQCVRLISARRKRDFRNNAKLLEAAVRHLAVFSSRSKEAIQKATEIVLIPDEKSPTITTASTATPERRVILPPGVDPFKDPRPPKHVRVEGTSIEVVPEEMPDVSERQKVNEASEPEAGSFERLAATFRLPAS
jgi:hypothetical protein